MLEIKIRLNSYESSNFRNFHESGEITVSAEVDTLSEGYKKLKQQVDDLLKEVNAENQLILDVSQLQKQVEDKKRTLRNLEEEITTARAQLNRLGAFLRRLGIDPQDYSLEISSFSDDSDSDSREGEKVEALPFNKNKNTFF